VASSASRCHTVHRAEGRFLDGCQHYALVELARDEIVAQTMVIVVMHLMHGELETYGAISIIGDFEKGESRPR
jgi:hypothetical protein